MLAVQHVCHTRSSTSAICRVRTMNTTICYCGALLVWHHANLLVSSAPPARAGTASSARPCPTTSAAFAAAARLPWLLWPPLPPQPHNHVLMLLFWLARCCNLLLLLSPCLPNG